MPVREPWTEEINCIVERGDPVKNKRAAVIGSGFGGLTLAVRLQAAGIASRSIQRSKAVSFVERTA